MNSQGLCRSVAVATVFETQGVGDGNPLHFPESQARPFSGTREQERVPIAQPADGGVGSLPRGQSTNACSMMFSSSRTFPGILVLEERHPNFGGHIGDAFCLCIALNLAMKCWMSRGMSLRRSRSGGNSMRITLIR